VEWTSTVIFLFFCFIFLLKGLFTSRISVWVFFLKFSLFLCFAFHL
jgi:hypothetical protein